MLLFHPVTGRRRQTDSKVITATVKHRPPSVSPSMSHAAVKPLLFGTYIGWFNQT
jgi:hypothetical protein